MSERRTIQAIRGMNDILPKETVFWQKIESALATIAAQYGYEEIRFPMLESTQLFRRTIGEVTDIVEKEMYTFTDLNGESVSLRPEGTASTVRACLEHGLFYHQKPRLWYMGPMFRHEKPQKGRYRQFHHFGIEVFGFSGVEIELELLSMCANIWSKLGLENEVRLEINTIGTLQERQAYRELLIEYFKKHESQLDEDSRRRLYTNPLRILDSKNPVMTALIAQAPELLESLGQESRERFEQLCHGLKQLGIAYTYNRHLVRGLDYYGQVVFEWVTDKLGTQATVCAGGRYDALVSQLGGEAIPAVGFAIGIERLFLLLEAQGFCDEPPQIVDVFMVVDNTPEAGVYALSLAEEIRRTTPLRVLVNLQGGGFKSQFKKADKSRAWVACIVGESEVQSNTVSVKWLREAVEQESYEKSNFIDKLKRLMKDG